MKFNLLLVAAAAVLSAPALGADTPTFGAFGFDVAGMDRSVRPGDDFYRFANGGWDQRTAIPADQARWGAFNVLRDQADGRTREALEAAGTGAPADGRKAAAYFASFMDEAAIERAGASPLKPVLAEIAAISDPAALARAMGTLGRDGLSIPFGLEVDADLRDNGSYALYLTQSGLGLPDRDYYLVDNAKFVEARVAYLRYAEQLLTLAGVTDAEAKAQAIYDLEKRLAQAHWSRVESRQIEKVYNPVATAELPARFVGFDWAGFLAASQVSPARVVVYQPSAMEGSVALVRSVPLQTWKDYLTLRAIAARTNVLPKAFVDADFAYRKVLTGVPELKVRWKRGVDLVNAGMGEAAGQLYVAKHFPPASKAEAERLVVNLVAAMRVRLEKLEWMVPETRAKALTKLAAFRAKIGYPTKWRDYAALEIRSGDAFGNATRAARHEHDFQVGRVGKPVDREEWQMTPQTVNAYANPPRNEIVFPAAILQAPFFDPNADDAINYGGIGAVIGHEISHHFDDQGRKFDPSGSLADWWTPADVTRFKGYTDRVVAQYGAYEPLPGARVNGELTLGENMADLAGLTVAYDAWRISLGGKQPPVLGGFTGEQRFFLGWAQVWRNKARDEFVQQQLTTDPHTPADWRPHVVRNLDAWYQAFGVQAGAKFYLPPDQRIRVW